MNKVITGLLFLLSASSLANESDCKKAAAQAEKNVTSASAKTLSKACQKTSVSKVGRPLMRVGEAVLERGDVNRALTFFKAQRQMEPDFPNALLNIAACYTNLKQYDRAIEAGKTGLKLAKKAKYGEFAKLNSNIGLAYFKKAAAAMDLTNREAEPFFKESQKIDPSIGMNYYYLGYFKRWGDSDAKAALKLYQKGCQLGYSASCKDASQVEAEITAGPSSSEQASKQGSVQAEPTPAVKTEITAEEKKLYDEIKNAYLKKGMPAASADAALESVKQSSAGQTKEIRIQILQSMVKALN